MSEHFILIDGKDHYHAATSRERAIEEAQKLSRQVGRSVVVALVVAEIDTEGNPHRVAVEKEDSNVIQT